MENELNTDLLQQIISKSIKNRIKIEDEVVVQYLNYLVGSPEQPITEISDERLLPILATHSFEKCNSTDPFTGDTKTHFIDNGKTFATIGFGVEGITVEAGGWYNVRN